MKSSSQHSFAVAPSVDIPRSSFKRNMTYKTTMNAGYLTPIYLDEVLPGDTFKFKLTSFSRILSALKYPIMDNLFMDFQFFFVPTRLVYDDYEKFFGSSQGQNGNWQYDDSHLMPGITSPSGGFQVGSVADYFGLPTDVAGYRVNALPFRAYNRIIADWYLPSVYELTAPTIKTDSTDDSPTVYPLFKRLKRADYFTACLPSPQRGPGVQLSIGGTAPIFGNGKGLVLTDGTNFGTLRNYNNYTTADRAPTIPQSAGSVITGTPSQTIINGVLGLPTKAQYDAIGSAYGNGGLYTDLTYANGTSINAFRQAFQLQRLLERDERSGVRYVSLLLSHFGVKSPDARLQRTEFLGSGSVPIQIHTVANTNGASGSTQGSLAAFGTSAQSKVGFVKSFVEHGYILGLASVRADLTYQQGIPRMFDRFARFDFYWPVFAHLGEQVVKNKEIYAQSDSVVDSDGTVVNNKPFGYQERYAEYRYSVSKITGQLRSTYAQTLDSWHLAQKFNNLPTLNSTFLSEDVPMSRVKADTSAPDFLYDSLIELNCVRPMPLFGVPGLVDHG